MSNTTKGWKKMLEVRAKLAEMAAEHGGRLLPQDVLLEAGNPDSPLHDRFEWDDSKAAHAYRLEQARELIRSVTVVITNSTGSVRTVAYVEDPNKATGQSGYVSVQTLRTDEELARDALCAEFRRVGDLLARARNIATAVGMGDQVAALIESVVRLRNSLVQEQPAQPQ